MDILKLFNQFKLGNSVFKTNVRIPKHTIAKSNIPAEQIAQMHKIDMANSMSGYILSKHQSAITEIDKGDFIELECELLVLKKQDFKMIVEAAIHTMSEESLLKIRAKAFL